MGRLSSLRRRAEPRTKWAWQRGLALRSRDDTVPSTRRSCLVLAAHPDDEAFACGATIMRKIDAGTPVKILIGADGRNANPTSVALSPKQLGAVRRAESAEVAALMGLGEADLTQLDHENLRSEVALADVRARVEALIHEFDPDEILVNSTLDYHPDHKAMHRIACDVVSTGHYRGRVAEYPIWYLFDGPWAATAETLSERPTHDGADAQPHSPIREMWEWVKAPVASLARLRPVTVDTEPFLDRKRTAIAAYRSQVTNYTGEESWTYLHDNFVSLFLQPRELFFPWRGGPP
jgi:LmbE family N-acetylglucosaminyl deacetylase